MKIYLLLTILSLSNFACINKLIAGDTRRDVLTPKGHTVEAYVREETSHSVRVASDQYWQSRYPNAIIITDIFNISSTRTYNCHGFAWHVSEGGENRWIGYYRTTDEDIYMTDTSYVLVPQEVHPGKVSWGYSNQSVSGPDDHSGITINRPGWYMSKWGEGPLMIHQRYDTPYDNTYLRFYIRTPTISGPSNSKVCYGLSATFTATNWQSGYSWSCSSNITITSGQGTNTVSVTGSGTSEPGWVSVRFNGSELTRYNVSVDSPPVIGATIDGPATTMAGVRNTYGVAASRPGYWFTWTHNTFSSVVATYTVGTMNYADVVFNSSGNLWVEVYARNACGVSSTVRKYVTVSPNDSLLWSFYPNPASYILNIEMDREAIAQAKSLEQATLDAKRLKTDLTYDIRLYDGQGNMLRRKTTKGGKTEFDVSSLSNGIYYLHIYDGVNDKPQMRQIVVEH